MTGSAAPDLLATLLSHPERVEPRQLEACDSRELLARASHEQVVPLASRALDAVAPASSAAATMHAAAAAWALREYAERAAIHAFLDAARGVPMLFFKGASMAYGFYDAPSLRMRDDWDVLVAPGAEARARAALLAAGFAPDRSIKPGRIRMRQQSFRRAVPGSECIVDLHLRTFNPPSLADRVTFADLEACTVALPSLHREARGIGVEGALAIACVHRLAHHSAEARLAWDYDVLLLIRCLDGQRARNTVALAGRWGVGAFIAPEIRRVADRFDVALDPDVAAALDALDDIPADAYARPHRSRAREFLLDWRELNWRDRAALVRETIAPDPAFMRASRRSRLPLPVQYLMRAVRGARQWFTRS